MASKRHTPEEIVAKWFIRHVRWYAGELSSAGDMSCVVPLYTCVT